MTDPRNPGTPPDDTSRWAPPATEVSAGPTAAAAPVAPPAASAASNGEPPMPSYEPAEPGTSAPAQTVGRDGGTVGPPAAGSRRGNGLRWAIALIGVALVVGVSAALIALAAGRPTPSIAVGYMPDEVLQYQEFRFDLPGTQRQELASFLSAFPGFDDQAAIDTKLDETFDRIVGRISEGEQTYTADIEPWFGGVVALGSVPGSPGDGAVSVFGASGEPLFVVSIKDRARAVAWIDDLSTESLNLERGEYNGAQIFTDERTERGPGLALAVNDEVILGGTIDAVHDAVDSQGDGALAQDDEFEAAFAVATQDYVQFSFMDYKALITAALDAMAETDSGLEATSVDDEILKLVPAWIATVARFENDSIEAETAMPSVDIGFAATNQRSTLLGYAPPETLVYGEVHDVGPALTALIDRFRALPELKETLDEVETTTGMTFADIVGWWGDASFVVSKDDAGLIGGGLLIAPTDATAAERLFTTVRSLVVFGGGQAGIEVRDVEHGDATITVIDFSGAAGAEAEMLPEGYKAEIAYAVTDEVVVIGLGQGFVESVLDAGPGPSLADDGRVSSLLDRVGEENIGFYFADVRGIRELVEPLAREDVPADEWANYETEIQPFLEPFDAVAGSVRKDGSTDRSSSVITVTKP